MRSVNYYKQLADCINQLEEQCKEVTYTVYPSTITCNRKSKFIKQNNNTNKLHNKVG